MSCYYEMTIEIHPKDEESTITTEQREKIEEAAAEEWEFDHWFWNDDGDYGMCTQQNNLCLGESEKEFSTRIARAIWKVAGYVQVTVYATCLENLPYNLHTMEEDDYNTWKNQEEK